MSINEENQIRVVDFQVDNSPQISNKSTIDPNNLEDLDFQSLFEAAFEDRLEERFSKNKIKKAGRKIRKNEGDLKDARSKIQSFRAEHEEPLKHISKIVSSCSPDDTQVVTRLKRLDTIIDKLTRPSLDGRTENKTCVTNMNDIAGCRAIFSDINCLFATLKGIHNLVNQFESISIKDVDNYIETPKGNDCGYRSVHVIIEYETPMKTLKVEVQLRTRVQHLWATSVEIIDLIERTKIKTLSHIPFAMKEQAQVHWEELLSLMSEVIAFHEGCITLGEKRLKEIKNKLRYLDRKVKSINKLKSFKMVSESIYLHGTGRNQYYIVVIGLDNDSVKVLAEQVFDDEYKALLIFNNIEKVASSMSDTNALMVATKDISSLSVAYPNYLGDCQAFTEMLIDAMT